jgi:hypothetical protein
MVRPLLFSQGMVRPLVWEFCVGDNDSLLERVFNVMLLCFSLFCHFIDFFAALLILVM